MSWRRIEGEGEVNLGCGFLDLEIVSGGGSKAVGMKNGCFKGSNESPHFTRPISIDRSTL